MVICVSCKLAAWKSWCVRTQRIYSINWKTVHRKGRTLAYGMYLRQLFMKHLPGKLQIGGGGRINARLFRTFDPLSMLFNGLFWVLSSSIRRRAQRGFLKFLNGFKKMLLHKGRGFKRLLLIFGIFNFGFIEGLFMAYFPSIRKNIPGSHP